MADLQSPTVVMASGAAIQSATGFVCMRLALGATESGLMPVGQNDKHYAIER